MSDFFANSNLLIIVQLIAIGIFIKVVIFPLLENLSLNTKKRIVKQSIPMHEIFFEYNHKNPEDWYAWISKQSSSKQAQAFNNLAQYLDHPPEQFTPVLNDVIRIITAFKKPGTETAIYSLLQRISVPNPPSEFYDYYAKALKSLIELNAQRAGDFLENEYRKHKSNPEYVKRFVYASSFFPSNRLPIKLLCSYLLNTDYLINDRLRLMESMKDKPESFYTISTAIIEKLLENKDIDPLITEFSYIKLLELKDIDQGEFRKFLRIIFNKTWASDHLSTILKNHLSQNANSSINPLSLASVISSIHPINYDSLRIVLDKRHDISEQENLLLDQITEINKFKENASLELGNAINIIDSNQETLPDFLEASFEDFKNFCFNEKYTSFKVLNECSENEHYLLIKRLANQENKKILILSIEGLVKDQTLLDNLETHLKVILNKILYIPGFEKIIKEISSGKDTDNLYRKILNRLKFLTLKSNIPIIVSCNKNLLDLKGIELLNNEKEVPKEEYELKNFSQEKRHSLIKEYLGQLNPDRQVEKSIPGSLYSKTLKKAPLEFTSFLLDYIRLSLLSQGKLFNLEEYETLLDKEEEGTVSIKDLVNKVNLD